MNSIATAIVTFFSALIMLSTWFMLFVIQMPSDSINSVTDQFWYQHSYWGLLTSSLISSLASVTALVIGFKAYRKGTQVISSIKSGYTRLLLLAAIGVIYAFFIMVSFIHVTCAC